MERRAVLKAGVGSLAAAYAGVGAPVMAAEKKPRGRALFEKDNLVAWCIVPFDAKMRGPEDRAEMMKRLGIKRFAYDWRAEHIPTFDRELDALQKRGISLDAFWTPCGAEPEKEGHIQAIFDFLRRRQVKTQLWVLTGAAGEQGTQAEKVARAAKPLTWMANEAEKLGCTVALYNHGGWFGEPENQIEIIQAIGKKNVGIVYNFHHGHPHIDRFSTLFPKMQPHLIALNINGMNRSGNPKILGVGKGEVDLEMLNVVTRSGWSGPVGILGHRAEMDAEVALKENLDGLKTLRPRLP